MEDYNEMIKELNTDPIANSVIKNNQEKSFEEIDFLIQYEYLKHTSHKWLPDDVVMVYPNIREMKSRKHYETIYGVSINKGTVYISYQALLVNISNGSKYVLKKPLRFEIGDNLPKHVDELEELEETTNIDIPIKRVDKTLKKKRIINKKI